LALTLALIPSFTLALALAFKKIFALIDAQSKRSEPMLSPKFVEIYSLVSQPITNHIAVLFQSISLWTYQLLWV
jgi:hypothetical protein